MPLEKAKLMPFPPISTRRRTSSNWSKNSGNARIVSFPFFGPDTEYGLRRQLTNICLLFPTELHVLVNNSGSTWGAPYDEYPSAAWTRVLTLNLQRVFDLTRLLTPFLEKGASEVDPSRIINIGSIDGVRVPQMETFAYSASKAGLHHLSRALANHLGKRNIT